MNDLTGLKFGKLKVLYRAGTTKRGSIAWLCKCECGQERVLSADHLTRKKRPSRSCGCTKKYSGKQHPLWRGYEDISGGWWDAKVLRHLRPGGHRKESIPVDLTMKEAWDLYIKQDRKCALTGVDIVISIKGNASIDRIDSSLGYSINNIQWVHKDVNMMKQRYSQEYFINTCKMVAEFNEGEECEICRDEEED